MPKPIKGESRQKWVNRCIPAVIKEGKTKDQAAGQCHGMYDYAEDLAKQKRKGEGGKRKR